MVFQKDAPATDTSISFLSMLVCLSYFWLHST